MPDPLKTFFHIDILKTIASFENTTGQLYRKNSPLSDTKTNLFAKNSGFKVDFEFDRFKPEAKLLDVGQRHKKIEFIAPDRHLVFEHIWLSNQSGPNFRFKGDVDALYTKGYSNKAKYYYRLIIPIAGSLHFHYQIQETLFSSDLLEWSRTATRATIEGDVFIAYVFEDKPNKKHFLAIETESWLNYEIFSEKAYALKNAIGYLTGYLAGDGGYFFAYKKKEMQYIEHYYYGSFRKTIKSSYNPVNTNPYSMIHHNKKTAKRYYEKVELRAVTFSELSEFATRLYTSMEFTGAIILILEASVASLLFMPGGFAIALETLSDLIIGDDKRKISPIQDKNKAKAIRKAMLGIIDEECGSLNAYDIKTLKVRIENINQVTNGSRLKAPFSKLGISLLAEDLAILEARNDFLHGRMPDISKTGVSGDNVRKSKDLYYASMRFYTLLSMLILKWIGFDDCVVNYPKIYEKTCQIKLKERYYRKI